MIWLRLGDVRDPGILPQWVCRGCTILGSPRRGSRWRSTAQLRRVYVGVVCGLTADSMKSLVQRCTRLQYLGGAGTDKPDVRHGATGVVTLPLGGGASPPPPPKSNGRCNRFGTTASRSATAFSTVAHRFDGRLQHLPVRRAAPGQRSEPAPNALEPHVQNCARPPKVRTSKPFLTVMSSTRVAGGGGGGHRIPGGQGPPPPPRSGGVRRGHWRGMGSRCGLPCLSASGRIPLTPAKNARIAVKEQFMKSLGTRSSKCQQ